MAAQETFAVEVFFSRPTNRDRVQLLDKARREVDYLGRPGIEAKRGQKDEVISAQKKLRLPFADRETARAYQHRVKALEFDELETKRFRIPPKRPNRFFLKLKGRS